MEIIEKDYRVIAVPMIDIVESERNFTYVGSSMMRGGIKVPDWSFDWITLASHQDPNSAEPYDSPTMAGGLFAIVQEEVHGKNRFFHLIFFAIMLRKSSNCIVPELFSNSFIMFLVFFFAKIFCGKMGLMVFCFYLT